MEEVPYISLCPGATFSNQYIGPKLNLKGNCRSAFPGQGFAPYVPVSFKSSIPQILSFWSSCPFFQMSSLCCLPETPWNSRRGDILQNSLYPAHLSFYTASNSSAACCRFKVLNIARSPKPKVI
uniref:Uncharacterized protein n=1 Tax=Micrurus paraensis TaxID=1970185 RepID=A0A2D4L039_9SAUR